MIVVVVVVVVVVVIVIVVVVVVRIIMIIGQRPVGQQAAARLGGHGRPGGRSRRKASVIIVYNTSIYLSISLSLSIYMYIHTHVTICYTITTCTGYTYSANMLYTAAARRACEALDLPRDLGEAEL